jgi:hypothetical protein
LPARVRSGPERRENAERLLVELVELPEGRRIRRLRERRFHDAALLDLVLETCHGALPFDLRRAVELATLAVELSSSVNRNREGQEVEEVFPLRAMDRAAASGLAVAYVLRILKLQEFEIRIIGA